ncbi:UNVERIFIED_CONTAM: hypothetical protein HDU68_003133 [Siphonaria sp. JEL0065]|nr:hypothetical protein HDU68_003133 [Siphonaria sp. JEL0065]
MDSHTVTIVGAVGGVALVVAGVAAVRQRGTSKAQVVTNRTVRFSTTTNNPVPHSIIQMAEIPDGPPPLMEIIQPITPTSATSARSYCTDATSATSVSSMDIGTPYTTLPMGGFHRESMKPMMEVESTSQGGYVLQQGVTVGEGTEKMLKSLIQ